MVGESFPCTGWLAQVWHSSGRLTDTGWADTELSCCVPLVAMWLGIEWLYHGVFIHTPLMGIFCFPLWGYHEWCYSEHLCTFLLVDIGFLSPGMELLSHIHVSLWKKMPNRFLELFLVCIPTIGEWESAILHPPTLPISHTWPCVSTWPSCWLWSMVSVEIFFLLLLFIVSFL